ncbi:HAD family hydrolase [Embleya scabrispora]|uniref:HAD family hydrolase n=1 Tax=Embleya scabrispora TaxID=159449 RepID=UPI00035EB850|nr:HAD family phosphatase [Embleya scabrispora]MYS87507.1 HAD-IA family hydrolase [Streptomyces sp. SID5474]
MRTEWIVFDFGGVICMPPPDHASEALARTVGVTPAEFWPAYWPDRAAYDAGTLSAAEFWSGLCVRLDRPVPDPDRLDLLVAGDLAAWMHLNQDTLDLLAELAELADRGVALALLSNAPAEMARHLDEQPWARVFRHRVFSADLGLAKPDPRIYHHLCAQLDAQPGELLFVDDRPENLDAARALGIESLLFTDTPTLRADLDRARATGSVR